MRQLRSLGIAVKIFKSGRSRQHAELAVAVDARRWHQVDEVVEQLRRRQDLRATADRARFPVALDEVLAVEFA